MLFSMSRPFLLLLFVGFFSSVLVAQEVRILEPSMDVEVKRLGQLNTSFEETNLSVTPNGRILFFMSDRGGQPWSQAWNKPGTPERFDGDLWYSEKTEAGWQAPQCLDGAVNTGSGEDEPNVSPDGKRVIYQSWRDDWLLRGGPYYLSMVNGKEWSKPRGLGGGIHRFFVREFMKYGGYGTDGAAVSPDGKKFVVACGSDYYGNMDLYYSTVNEFGQWTMLKKLNLSTSGNERSVFFGADSRTLYFSSDAYTGFGGLDIFKTTLRDDGSHGEIVNLGKRFNTAKDDYGFIISATGQDAFFVREGDIYTASLKNVPSFLKSASTALIHGTVKQSNGLPVSLRVRLVDEETGEEVLSTYSSSEDGSYSLFVTAPDRSLRVEVEKEGLLAGEEEVAFQSSTYSEKEVDFTVPTLEKELIKLWVADLGSEENLEEVDIPVVKRKVFQYIYFGFGSPRTSIKDRFRLKRVVAYLKKNPNQTVKVSGYSDMRGDRSLKDRLARERAKAVCRFLLQQGIEPHRITGEYFPNAHHYKPQASTPYQGVRKVEISFPEQNQNAVAGIPIELSGLEREQMDDRGKELAWAKVLIDLQKQIDANPKDPDPYMNRALIYAMKGEHEKALEDFQEAIDRGGNLAEVCMYRASILEETNDLKGALFDYNKILEREPKNALAYYNRGNLKYRKGDTAGACRDWVKANRYSPGIADGKLKNCN